MTLKAHFIGVVTPSNYLLRSSVIAHWYRRARTAFARRLRGNLQTGDSISTGHSLLERQLAAKTELDGWLCSSVGRKQDDIYRILIQQMRDGKPRQDLFAAAEAVRMTGLADLTILEVGCGSGYYLE